MSSRPPARRLDVGWTQRYIWTTAVVLVALFTGMAYEGYETWSAYNKTFGAHAAAKDWLNRKLTSYSVDTYEELLAIKRLQIYCQRYALGSMDKQTFSIHRRQVIGSFASFKPGTLIEQEVSNHESFKPAYEAVQVFLDTAKQFEDGKTGLGRVFDIGEEAAAAWGRLAEDVIAREFEIRDGMEKAIVDFRPLAVRTFTVTSILLALCALAIASAGYAVRQAWVAERRRFDRFELILSTVGHDLRSPLQALVGAAKLAAADAVPAEREKFVGIVHERSAFFTRLLDDLIDLSRSASLSFVPVHVDIPAWFEMACTRYKQAAHAKGLAFECSLSNDVSAILFDTHRLTQCADNLLFNAIRYTDTGSIGLHVLLRTQALPGSAMLELKVVDTGRGIAIADQARIFEPFVRVEGDAKGMGVGLSMVANLARSQNGSVAVMKSALGEGSTFLLRLPADVSKVQVDPSLDEIDRDGLHSIPPSARSLVTLVPRVLVVDDDPVITQVVAGLLPHMGFAADDAVGGRAGLKMALVNSYCAVITDVQMPDVDGFELAKTLRENASPCPMLIALTAYTSRKAVIDRSDVFDAVLRKPFDEVELAELLDQAAMRWSAPA